jgi:hypothetical protein
MPAVGRPTTPVDTLDPATLNQFSAVVAETASQPDSADTPTVNTLSRWLVDALAGV